MTTPPPPHTNTILPPTQVVVHPLVLLSVVDHYHRVAHDTKKRVVGILLGESFKGRIDVSNSFAVPFEEDAKDDSIWFLDHDFVENMYRMFLKVNAKERMVGFYSTGPKLRSNDLAIEADIRQRYKFTTAPVLTIIDVRPESTGLPTQAFFSVETTSAEELDKTTRRAFKPISSEVGAYEAEEVGVEHLLRDINDPTVSTLASKIRHKMDSLRGLRERLREIHTYLMNVSEKRLPPNRKILANIQEIVNLLPNLNLHETVSAFLVKTNDMHLVIYVASLIRAITALHTLLTNKLDLKKIAADQENEKSSFLLASATSSSSSSSTPGTNGGAAATPKEAKKE